jgi:hypothetical protein
VEADLALPRGAPAARQHSADLSLILLMGAGVMFRSLLALRNVDAGFDPQDVLTMRLSLPETQYATAGQKTAFFDSVLERIRALPGVQAAGGVDDLPVLGGAVQEKRGNGAHLKVRAREKFRAMRLTPASLTPSYAHDCLADRAPARCARPDQDERFHRRRGAHPGSWNNPLHDDHRRGQGVPAERAAVSGG